MRYFKNTIILLISGLFLFSLSLVSAEEALDVVTVPYTITGVNAEHVNEPLKGNVEFKKGDKSRDIELTIKDNNNLEGKKSVSITLSVDPEPVGVTLNKEQKSATGTIDASTDVVSTDVKKPDKITLTVVAKSSSESLTVAIAGSAVRTHKSGETVFMKSIVNFSDTATDERKSVTYLWSTSCEGDLKGKDFIQGSKTESIIRWKSAPIYKGETHNCTVTLEAKAADSAASKKTADAKVVKKVASIAQKEGKTEFKEGTDKTITYTVTLSCPANTVECSASTCAKDEASCPNAVCPVGLYRDANGSCKECPAGADCSKAGTTQL